jgi:hypothetical protein
MAINYACRLPNPAGPVVDPSTGAPTVALWHWMLAMFVRTGDAPGIGSVDSAALAAAATAAATAASGAVITEAGVRLAADTAEAATRAAAVSAEATARATAVTSESTTRAGADTTLTTNLAAETSARIAADLLLAPKANPAFTSTVTMPIFTNALTDAAAAIAGVAVGQLYRNGSIVMQRII